MEDGGRRYGKVTATTQAAGEPWYGAPSPLRLRGRPISLHSVMGTFMLGTRCSAYVPVGYRIFGVFGLFSLHVGAYSYSARAGHAVIAANVIFPSGVCFKPVENSGCGVVPSN